MSNRDSHPELWLDRGTGQLREDERVELDRHLGQCDACALHDKISPSLMDQVAVLPGDSLLINDAIQHAVQGFVSAPPPALKVVRPGRLLAMSAAGALVVGGAGLAGVWAVGTKSRATPPAVVAPPPAPAPAGPGRDRTAPPVAAPELVPAPDLVEEERAPAASDAAGATAKPAATDTSDAPRGKAVTESPAELFASANVLRRGKDYAEAERLYRRLQSAFPGSPEDVLSRIVLGRMYLDQLGDPRAALRQFDRYLNGSSNSSLRDEAMIGRALALGRLGRRGDERAAWLRFLDAYPDSMYVPKARARLRELGQ